MLSPKRIKFRKRFKGRFQRQSKGGNSVEFGQYGIKSLGYSRVSARQIEAARRAITRHIKRIGKVWIRVFPDLPVSQKPAEVRMGSGKGSVEYWAARVEPGRVLFEVEGVSEPVVKEALRLGAMKLPVQTKIVGRHVCLKRL